MEATIIAVGNGGYHLAIDIINTGIIDSPQLIVCDTNATDLERNSEKATKTVLLETQQFTNIDSRMLSPRQK